MDMFFVYGHGLDMKREGKRPDIKCDKYIIIPNNFHAIIQNAGG
jgi:hypothetical protein